MLANSHLSLITISVVTMTPRHAPYRPPQVPVIVFLFNNANITWESTRNMVMIFSSRAGDLKKEKRRAETILSGMLPKEVGTASLTVTI